MPNSFIEITSTFTSAVPKVNVVPEYEKSVVVLEIHHLKILKIQSTVLRADTAKPVVEPSPVYALTTGLSLKVFCLQLIL